MSITLSELRTQSRQRADMENSEFVTDSELNSYINSSIAELHDILIQSYGADYRVKSVEFTTTSSDSYELSSIITDNDFYKLNGVDAKLNGSIWTTLFPFNFNERNKHQTTGLYSYLGVTSLRYRVVGSKIYLSPTPDNATAMRVWYTPVATKLTIDADTLDDLNQYAEYVIVDAAIKMMQKEESDVSVLLAQKAGLKRRIEEVANNRDVGNGDSISDVYAGNEEFLYGRTID